MVQQRTATTCCSAPLFAFDISGARYYNDDEIAAASESTHIRIHPHTRHVLVHVHAHTHAMFNSHTSVPVHEPTLSSVAEAVSSRANTVFPPFCPPLSFYWSSSTLQATGSPSFPSSLCCCPYLRCCYVCVCVPVICSRSFTEWYSML